MVGGPGSRGTRVWWGDLADGRSESWQRWQPCWGPSSDFVSPLQGQDGAKGDRGEDGEPGQPVSDQRPLSPPVPVPRGLLTKASLLSSCLPSLGIPWSHRGERAPGTPWKAGKLIPLPVLGLGGCRRGNGRDVLVSGYLWLGCGMCSWPSLVWLIPWVFFPPLGFDLCYLLTYQDGHRMKGLTS